jgi:hypothetical protein
MRCAPNHMDDMCTKPSHFAVMFSAVFFVQYDKMIIKLYDSGDCVTDGCDGSSPRKAATADGT